MLEFSQESIGKFEYIARIKKTASFNQTGGFLMVTELKDYFDPLIPACNNNAPNPPILLSCGLSCLGRCGFFA